MKVRKMVLATKTIRGTVNKLYVPDTDKARIEQLKAAGYNINK